MPRTAQEMKDLIAGFLSRAQSVATALAASMGPLFLGLVLVGVFDAPKVHASALTAPTTSSITGSPTLEASTVKAAPFATLASFGGNAVQSSARALAPVVQALEQNNGAQALALVQAISDANARDLGFWLIGRFGADGVPLDQRVGLRDSLANWPGASIVARRTESAILSAYGAQTPPLSVFGSSEAVTIAARVLQARALNAAGQQQAARTIASDLWRTNVLDDGLEGQVSSALGALLTQEDHRARAHWLLYRDRVRGAERLFGFLTSADQAAINARGLAIREGGAARARLEAAHRANPSNIHLTFELARLHRRADRPRDAANLLIAVTAPAEEQLRSDMWWRERRIISRDLLEAGDPTLAYRVVEQLSRGRPTDQADQAFTAGWIALRFLNDASRAEAHFRQLLEIGTTPITIGRAHYWIGRSLSAQGQDGAAGRAYRQAMDYGETFYGQAAATAVSGSISFPRLPSARTPNAQFFSMAEMLYLLNRRTDARIFLYSMAGTETDPSAVVAMTNLASHYGDAEAIVQLGKIGARNHRSLALLGYPTNAFPANAPIPERLPREVAYAIARQESGFNATARSSAGALGLMQLMPATARLIARDMGVSHSTGRLTSDPTHNVRLGAYHLDELIADYGGSYILTFIAYNAGPGRVPEWIGRFGDPRTGQIDVIDWIELIPFSETRSYVQRVLENIFVYQKLLGSG
ncbi:MAG: transglycosylase SLT domain-containing protein [Pseudomonadota bacterium]